MIKNAISLKEGNSKYINLSIFNYLIDQFYFRILCTIFIELLTTLSNLYEIKKGN